MWDRAIFSKYNTSAYHIVYVLENHDGSVAVQIRHTLLTRRQAEHHGERSEREESRRSSGGAPLARCQEIAAALAVLQRGVLGLQF